MSVNRHSSMQLQTLTSSAATTLSRLLLRIWASPTLELNAYAENLEFRTILFILYVMMEYDLSPSRLWMLLVLSQGPPKERA